MEFEPVIGLEVHIQLNTSSKIFCNCSTKFGERPNSNVCPVCLGLPGVLPVLNKEVLRKAILASLALNCSISNFSKFDRKHYFYPDLPKNYQISQYDLPLAKNGYIIVNNKKIRIKRVHMEEDAGKLIHSEDSPYSYVDFNRTGVPLIEIVTEPDINSPSEAYMFLNILKNRMKYIEVSDCNMEEGSLRCDANISVRVNGSDKLGVKTEIKNMNSFRAVEKALEYEFKRQVELIKSNQKIEQETRLWDSINEITISMRSKEEAHDYRYFPEPDLPPIIVEKDFIEKLKETLPEMPDEKFKRYVEDLNIPPANAEILITDKIMASFFENCCAIYNNYKSISNWIISEIIQYLNKNKIEFIELKNLKPENFVELVKLVDEGRITSRVAKDISVKVIEEGISPLKLVSEKELTQLSDAKEIEKLVDEVINTELDAVKKYKEGKKNILSYLVGQVMKKSQGRANPKLVAELFEKKL